MACFNAKGVMTGAMTGPSNVDVDVDEEVAFCLAYCVSTDVLFTVNLGFRWSDFPFPGSGIERGGGIEEVDVGRQKRLSVGLSAPIPVSRQAFNSFKVGSPYRVNMWKNGLRYFLF